MLADALRVAALGGANVFMAPEYFFNFDGSSFQPCPAAVMDDILHELRTLSLMASNILFVPGTIIWTDDSWGDKKPPLCRNSAFVFLGGERVESNDQRRRYDKCGIDYEKSFGPANLRNSWMRGGTPKYDFQFQGLRCRLEICKDHGTEPDPAPDLQLVTATALGGASRGDVHAGGWCIHADGTGFAVKQQKGTTNRERTTAITNTFELDFTIPA